MRAAAHCRPQPQRLCAKDRDEDAFDQVDGTKYGNDNKGRNGGPR